MKRSAAAVFAVVLAAGGAAGCNRDTPDYDLTLELPSTRDGGELVRGHVSEGATSLKLFPCDVSLRLGQCVDARPVQLVIVPASKDRSGTNDCGENSARNILADNIGRPLSLGFADAGAVWIQAFHGDDDDDSNLVERAEMNAYAELRRGTITITSFDGETLEGTVQGVDPQRGGSLDGTLGAIDGDSTGTPGVGPQCTWPIGAKAN